MTPLVVYAAYIILIIKVRGAPPEEVASVSRAQDVLSKARVVNVESQLTTVSIDVLHSDSVGGSANDDDDGGGDDDNDDDGNDDPSYAEPKLVGDVAEENKLPGVDASVELPSYEITDYTANEFDVHERTAHYMEHRPISGANRIAVKAVNMVEAITLVKSMRTMRRQEIAERVQEKYKAFSPSIPIDRFSDSTIRAMMLEKYYRAKGTSADGLLTKATNVLKNVRAMAVGIRGVGTPLHQIPSGRSLCDIRNEFILTKWSAAQGTIYAPSNNDGGCLIPQLICSLPFLSTGAIQTSLRIQLMCPPDRLVRLSAKKVEKTQWKEGRETR
jgi:hypothetical protein